MYVYMGDGDVICDYSRDAAETECGLTKALHRYELCLILLFFLPLSLQVVTRDQNAYLEKSEAEKLYCLYVMK